MSMNMKMKIISTLALTTAFTFASSTALAAEAMSQQGAPAPVVGHDQVMNGMTTSNAAMNGQQMQYDVLNNQIGYVSDANTGMGLLGNRIRVTGYMNVGAFAQQSSGSLVYAPTSNGDEPKSNQSAVDYSGRLFFLADANNWIHATLGLYYAGTKNPIGSSANAFTASSYYGQGYGSVVNEGSFAEFEGSDPNYNQITVDQAFVDIKDFRRAPIALRIGRAYTPFGTYDLNAAVPTFTQQMSETREELVQASYSGRNGLYGAAYAFNGLNKRNNIPNPENYINPASNGDDDVENGGIKVGYHGMVDNYGSFHYNLSAGYVVNMLDAGSYYKYLQNTGYTSSVGGWSVHGDLLVGAFGLTANYVSAADDISASDFVRVSNNVTREAKPSAGNIYGSFHFMTYGHRSAIRAGYEWTNEAALFTGSSTGTTGIVPTAQSFVLPADRYAVGYNINVLANTTVGVGFNYDDSYSRSDGGSGDASQTEWFRVTVAM